MSMAVVYRYGNEPRDRFFLLSIIILIINFCYYFVQRNTNYCFTSAIILKFAFILPSKKIEFTLLLLQYISDIYNSDVRRLLEALIGGKPISFISNTQHLLKSVAY